MADTLVFDISLVLPDPLWYLDPTRRLVDVWRGSPVN
jgi:hypothetical protein